MSKTELQQKLGTLRQQATEALDEIRSNTDAARAAELESRHDAIMAEFDSTEAALRREERHADIEARFEQRSEEAERRAREARRPGGTGEVAGVVTGSEGQMTYRDAFIALARAGFDPQSLSAEARAIVQTGITKPGGEEVRAQSTTAAAGGYTVPTELAAVVDKTMAIWGPMYDEAICTVLNTAGGGAIDFPTTNDTTTAIAQHTEASAMTDDGGVDAVLAKMTLNAYAYDTEWVQISMELLQDSAINIEQFIGELLGERIARRVNTELTAGDGTGDPNGIVTASALGKTAASTTALAADEIIDLLHSVNPAYRASPKARFMFSDTTLASIRKLKDGNGQYLWQMGDIRTGEPGRLLGFAYSINQAMATAATGTKPIVFGDFSKYYVRKVGSPVIGVRREYYWPNIGMAGIVRLDGDLIQANSVKHLIMA